MGPFSLKQGVIQFKGQIWLHAKSKLKLEILQDVHSSAAASHLGFAATYHRVKRLFAWPQMKQEIKDYVAACEICQQVKPERVKYPRFLQPLKPPGYLHGLH
jgi:hypothetical protein